MGNGTSRGCALKGPLALPMLLLMLLLTAFTAAGCGGGERPATGGDRPAQAGFREDVFIETTELAGLVGGPDMVIIDARPEADYEQAHLPGAVRLGRDAFRPAANLKNILVYKAESGFPIPPDLAEDLFGRAGIDERTRVVAYDSISFPDASAVWAVLTYFGHPHVRVLKGGFEKWVSEGRPVTTEQPAPTPKRFQARPDPDLVAGRQWLLDNRDRVIVLDMRSLGEYSGIDTGELDRGGHIPGAINIDWRELAGDATIGPAAQIREVLRQKGLDDVRGKEIVTYCNIGVGRSTYGFMVLRALGFDRVRVYGGSFEDWSESGRTQVSTNRVGSKKEWLR